jgi:hypothetical protein
MLLLGLVGLAEMRGRSSSKSKSKCKLRRAKAGSEMALPFFMLTYDFYLSIRFNKVLG